MSALRTNAKGNYFGGLNNEAVIDLFDVPTCDPLFDHVAAAADREMLAVVAYDKHERITEDSVRSFVTLDEAA